MKSEIWNVKYDIWNMKSELWNVKYEISNVKFEIRNLKSEIWNLAYGIGNPKSEIWNMKSEIWTPTSEIWNMKPELQKSIQWAKHMLDFKKMFENRTSKYNVPWAVYFFFYRAQAVKKIGRICYARVANKFGKCPYIYIYYVTKRREVPSPTSTLKCEKTMKCEKQMWKLDEMWKRNVKNKCEKHITASLVFHIWLSHFNVFSHFFTFCFHI